MAKQKKIVEVYVVPKEPVVVAPIRDRVRGKGKIKIVKRQKVNNKELTEELIKFKATGAPSKVHSDYTASERLGEIFMDLVENFATKKNFSSYSYLEEMKSRAIQFLLMYSKSFNPEKSNNAFAYCTQIVKNAFIQVIKKEKKRQEGKKAYIEKYYNEKSWLKKSDDLLP